MQRIAVRPRPDWQATAERLGFNFHSLYGEPYWDESHAYRFSLRQIEDDIEAPSQELHDLCMDVLGRVVREERWLKALRIPDSSWDYVTGSWKKNEGSLYGRLDLRYDGRSPAKLYEYNADTPTSLYETAVFQWVWLEEAMQQGIIPAQSDQFNLLQEKLIARLRLLSDGQPWHFTCVNGSEEDRGTLLYLEDCAQQAGLRTHSLPIEDIGAQADGQFCDLEGNAIHHLFKLYPWEWLLTERYAELLPNSRTHFYEPAWKQLLSNKGLLALLWEFHRGHPNLLPCYFEGDARIAELQGNIARKPLFSREGANVRLEQAGVLLESVDGPYGQEGAVVQALCEPACFDGNYAVIGSWIIGNEACGMGMREDRHRVTRDLSRFVPHFISDL